MSRAKQSGQGLMFEELQSRAPYIIEQLEVYNWGPFSGLHRAEIDPHGSAIIGQTGSGKTTLVDALMTLVAARPLYNLASGYSVVTVSWVLATGWNCIARVAPGR